MATRKSLNVKVNLEYLEVIQAKSGLTKKKFWESLGRSDSMQWAVTSSGKMPPLLATLMCKLYGGDYDRLVIKEKPADEESAAQQKAIIDSNTLLIMANTLERIEQKQDKTADALLILKNQLDETVKILRQLL